MQKLKSPSEDDDKGPLNVLMYKPSLEGPLKGIRESVDEDSPATDGTNESSDSSASSSDSEEDDKPTTKISAIKIIQKSPEATQWGLARALAPLTTVAIRNMYITMANSYGDTDFYNTVISSDNIIPFGIMFTSVNVAVVHSLAVYSNMLDTTTSGLHGLVGDVSKVTYPTPLKLKKTWVATKSMKHGPKNTDKLYEKIKRDPKTLWAGLESLDAALKEQRPIPFMIVLFPDLAEYLRPMNCTPLEVIKWLTKFIANKKLDKNDFELYYDYFKMAACSKKASGEESLMALTCKPILNLSDKFESWRKKQLIRLFGENTNVQRPPSNPPPQIQPPAGNPPTDWTSSMNDLMASQRVMVDTVTTLAEQSGRSGKAKPQTLSERKRWYLVGLCQGTSLADVPRVWPEMIKSSTYEDSLDIFEKALVRENEKRNAGMNKPVIFQSQVKKMLALEHSTYERFSRDTRHNVVLGFSDFLPKMQKEFKLLLQHDRTVSMTPETSMDYNLIQKLQQIEKGNKEPTIKISIFQETLTGYCVSLRV